MENRYTKLQWDRAYGLVEHIHPQGISSRPQDADVIAKPLPLESFRLAPFLPPPFPEIRVGACQECGLVVFATPPRRFTPDDLLERVDREADPGDTFRGLKDYITGGKDAEGLLE